jgi:hypothetical protein
MSSFRSVRSGEEKIYNVQAAALIIESLRTEITSLSALENVTFEPDGSGISFTKKQLDTDEIGKSVDVSYKFDSAKKNIVRTANSKKTLLGHGRIEGFKIVTNFEKDKVKFPTWVRVEVVTTKAKEETRSSEVMLKATIYPRMANKNLQIRAAGASYNTE